MAYVGDYSSGNLDSLRIKFFKDRGAISKETAIPLDDYERAELLIPSDNSLILNTPFTIVNKTSDNKFYIRIEAWKNQTKLSYVLLLVFVLSFLCFVAYLCSMSLSSR